MPDGPVLWGASDLTHAANAAVAVRAVSVNPIDTKQRRLVMPANGAPRVLGFDAAGIVDAVGSEVRTVKPGDHVVITGNPGRNAVDHRVRMRSLKRPSDGFGWGFQGETFD